MFDLKENFIEILTERVQMTEYAIKRDYINETLSYKGQFLNVLHSHR